MNKLKSIFLILIICIQLYGFKTYTADISDSYSYRDINSADKKINFSTTKNEEVLFIMDYSGSMNKKMGFTPKSFLAIDAIRDILDEIGAETKIGLRVFGITDKATVEHVGDSYRINKEVLCSASDLVLPIARYNSSNISDRIFRYTPQGATPIGYSLRQAVQNDFSPDAELKHIILVTDGNENCGDDPCFYIRRLMELRDDYKIDVIGITVNDNAFSQLKCIADAGKGNYYSVESPDDFRKQFFKAINSNRANINYYSEPPIFHKENTNDGTIYKNYTFQFDI